MNVNRLMSASPVDFRRLRVPVLGSSKIDGIRAGNQEIGLHTRKLLSIPNIYVNEAFGGEQLRGFDGELTAGSPTDCNCMQNTQSVVFTRNDPTPVDYHVFDLVGVGSTPYRERYQMLSERVQAIGNPRIILVEQRPLRTVAEIEAYLVEQLNLGYEGVMTRDPEKFYKNGRSTPIGQELGKVKLFEDAEAEIIGFIEMQHNFNEATIDAQGLTKRSKQKANLVPAGMLGKFIVRDLKTGVVFKLSGRISLQNRKDWWAIRHMLIGKIVTYKHFKATGVKIKPRLPVFKCFRHPLDVMLPHEEQLYAAV